MKSSLNLSRSNCFPRFASNSDSWSRFKISNFLPLNQLRKLAQRLGDGQLEIPVAASYRLADAARALAQATGGHVGGAIVLIP